MLQKINCIKNIGRCYNVSVQGTADSDPSFKKFNLIYADNGTGKSTISTILKSLWYNDPARLIEKHTIGASDASVVNIQVNNTAHTFENNEWNTSPDMSIEVFDEEFVAKNAFSPNGVEPDNRRELFNYIVLGEENVAKVNEVKSLDRQIREDFKDSIETVESTLKEAADIHDIKILDGTAVLEKDMLEATRKKVANTDKIILHADRIIKEKKLDKIKDFDSIDYTQCIALDLSSLLLAAEYKSHVQSHNEWIKDGVEMLQDDENDNKCPFCFQDIEGSTVVSTYKTLFSEEYETLRKKVGQQLSSADQVYSDAAVANVKSFVDRNTERCVFWHKLDEKIPELLSLGIELDQVTAGFKRSLLSVLERKKDNLLESIKPNEGETQGLAQESVIRQAIADYNTVIDILNEKIESVKKITHNVEEMKLQNEKDRTTVACNNVGFQNEETAQTYKNLKQYRKDKKAAEARIRELREAIDQASLLVLEKYQNSINRELENFGVEFSIEGVRRKSDRSRTEGVHFNIVLKGKSFNPNGSSDSPYKLSNTLSSGDKSTLAFAFFIAKYRNEDISNRILVFDDPITSLDFFRKNQTKNTILRFAKEALQVIVLTHSMEFARLFKGAKGRFIHIQKNNLISGLSFTPYNKFPDMRIEKHSYNQNKIQSYIADPVSVNRLDVMKLVRPYTETTIRQYCPDFVLLSLGKMIERLKNQGDICEDYIEDLETINAIVAPESSHGSAEINADDFEHIVDDELLTACEKAMQISAPPIRIQNFKKSA